MGIPMLNIRWLEDRLIFNMVITMLVRRHHNIETAPRWPPSFISYSHSHSRTPIPDSPTFPSPHLFASYRLSPTILHTHYHTCLPTTAFLRQPYTPITTFVCLRQPSSDSLTHPFSHLLASYRLPPTVLHTHFHTCLPPTAFLRQS